MIQCWSHDHGHWFGTERGVADAYRARFGDHDCSDRLDRLLGTKGGLVDAYRAPFGEHVAVAPGSSGPAPAADVGGRREPCRVTSSPGRAVELIIEHMFDSLCGLQQP
jgi:hypothetical protein